MSVSFRIRTRVCWDGTDRKFDSAGGGGAGPGVGGFPAGLLRGLVHDGAEVVSLGVIAMTRKRCQDDFRSRKNHADTFSRDLRTDKRKGRIETITL